MILKVSESNVPELIRKGDTISLSNNGADVRLSLWPALSGGTSVPVFDVLTFECVQIRWHMNDSETTLELEGFVDFRMRTASQPNYRKVRLMLA